MIAEGLKNKQGFPLEECRRCGGSGSFGPTSVHGGRCFDCNGSGLRITRKASAAWTEYAEAQRKHWHPTAAELHVGDRIRVLRKSDPLLTVTAVRWELEVGRSAGSSTRGTEGSANYCASSRLWVNVYVTTEDGVEHKLQANNLVASRAGRVDPAPYLAKVGA